MDKLGGVAVATHGCASSEFLNFYHIIRMFTKLKVIFAYLEFILIIVILRDTIKTSSFKCGSRRRCYGVQLQQVVEATYR